MTFVPCLVRSMDGLGAWSRSRWGIRWWMAIWSSSARGAR